MLPRTGQDILATRFEGTELKIYAYAAHLTLGEHRGQVPPIRQRFWVLSSEELLTRQRVPAGPSHR